MEKQRLYPVLATLIISIVMVGCVITDIVSSLLFTPTSYPCNWTRSANVYFLNPELRLPDFTCIDPFQNDELSVSFPSYSFYELMIGNAMYREPYYSLTWTASVHDKTCNNGWNSKPSEQIIFTQDDFWGRFLRSSCDWIEIAPLIQFNEGIGADDIKHELVFKLSNVENTWDGSHGYITWEKTWIGQNYASYDNNVPEKWEFDFSSGPLIGTYHPENGYPRKIYVHDQYIYY